MTVDKRRRNARPSKYRPRTDDQKRRRRELWEARSDDRRQRQSLSEEDRLKARMSDLETALRDRGQTGVHSRRNSRPLETITDDAERFSVLKARVERLEALWSIDRRKRETRGKIIIGGALLVELVDALAAGDRTLLTALLDILDRRVEAVRDRLTVRELLGDAPLPLRPGGGVDDELSEAHKAASESAPDFDLMVHSAMAEERPLDPSQIDSDYADLDGVWAANA